MATDGDRIIIGAHADDTLETDSGSASVFEISTGNLIEQFTHPGPNEGEMSGSSVAILGNLVLSGGSPNRAAWLVFSLGEGNQPAFGGTLFVDLTLRSPVTEEADLEGVVPDDMQDTGARAASPPPGAAA